MSSIGRDLPEGGVPLSALCRDPPPVVVPARVSRASAATRRLILARLAARHLDRLGTLRRVALAMGRSEEYVRDLLADAGLRLPRRRVV